MPGRNWILGTVPTLGKVRWYATLLGIDPNVETAVSRGRLARMPRTTDTIGAIRTALKETYQSDSGNKVVVEIMKEDTVPAISGLTVFEDAASLRAALDADADFSDSRSDDNT